ncbi:hypothetical protein O181_111447 [Austropuccinia psidii MF-1]|uniref:Uncharacterized protein n=1 Tax=Austropuccinia psidii MF-1 TaxID=1389203 RepID=A0A9Q3PTD7_9BASI|nr:hypothetical protein [Austropuccinia psidii MF-1]
MKSPTSILHYQHDLIEPELHLNRLFTFGIKVTIKLINLSSKIEPSGETLQALTFERYSDGLRLLNLETGKVRVSRDFNPTLSMNQLQQALPTIPSLTVKLQIPTSKVKESLIKQSEDPMVTHPIRSRSNVPSI